MTKRFRIAPCLAATAAAALASFTGLACAQAAAGAQEQMAPGYAYSGVGNTVVRNAFGGCVRTGFWTPAMSVEPCDQVARASVPVAVVRYEERPTPTPVAVAQPEPPRMVIQKVTLSTDLLFEFDKAQLRDAGRERLDQLATDAKDAQVEQIVATGYADPIGPEAYNEKLSAERAAAVREYLVQKGVAAEKIKSEGRGETRTFTENQCAKLRGQKLIDCFEPNRRVDVELLGSRQVAAGDAAGAGASR